MPSAVALPLDDGALGAGPDGADSAVADEHRVTVPLAVQDHHLLASLSSRRVIGTTHRTFVL
jgi:hypothetical protein